MPLAPASFDVADDGFVAEVLDASATVPVVVDFWAPWCGPCRNLGPLLERLAEAADGAWRLAKVNVDESPRIAAQFQVSSIPLVIGFRDGRAVSEFTGAQPEAAVREFLKQVLPSEADRRVSEGLAFAAEGEALQAEASFRAALDEDARHGAALIGLAGVLAAKGESEAALEALDRVTGGSPDLEHAAERLAAEIRTVAGSAGNAQDAAGLRERIASNPDDLGARLELGRALAAERAYEEALGELLAVVERDRSFADEAARKAILDLFELLGSDHELTQVYRGKLAQALFR